MPDRAAEARFLDSVFDDVRFRSPRYLPWLYDENPDGDAIVAHSTDEDGDAIGHYALVPQTWRDASGAALLGITLDAAVRPSGQRQGSFTEIARDVFARAGERGVRGTITVANANSTPAFVRKLDLTLLRALPVLVAPRGLRPARTVTDHLVDAALLADTVIDRLAADCAAVVPHGWIRAWTPASLRWRLSSPIGEYVLHESRTGWAVSTASHVGPLRAAVVLKIVPRAGTTRVATSELVTAACHAHRAPAAVYAGFNAHAAVRGMPVPTRLRPAPLNLLVRSFEPPDRALALDRIDTYEFLDADHY